ncbi:MAG: GGDEF domain-containing protein [Campylobacterales bacterium]|nr:GGDEF domain-containing protein [Campylobacterales bacterium]
MLLSTLLERERRFKIALRAGIPAILFIFVVGYIIFIKDTNITISVRDSLIMGGIVFATIYFIYFMLELATKGTLLDKETDGFNQKAFLNVIKHRKPKSIALLAIHNIDTINQNYGLEKVNAILHDIIATLDIYLSQHGVSNTIIGRYSGTKFLIALNRDTQEIENILESYIKEYHEIAQIEIDYIFSVVSSSENYTKDIFFLIDSIAYNMDESDEGSRVIVKDAKKEQELEVLIKEALNSRFLFFSFRQLLNATTQKVDIYTIAPKIILNDTRELQPREYLPIINRLGLGQVYDLTLFKQVVDTASLIDDSISLSFNISPFSLRDRGFLKNAFDYVEKQQVNPSRLIIEIYEKNTHHNLTSYLNTLDFIREKGVRISIDNFGSSNSSFDYIKYFKFDMVQFDRDFVRRMDNPKSLALFKSLLKMCKDLNIITIAKWVDEEQQKQKLMELGIDYMQGFGIKKPISKKELIVQHN